MLLSDPSATVLRLALKLPDLVGMMFWVESMTPLAFVAVVWAAIRRRTHPPVEVQLSTCHSAQHNCLVHHQF